MQKSLTKQANNDLDVVRDRFPFLKRMTEKISENLPDIKRQTSFFMKSQSQFMDNMLTIGGALSGPTPLRNIRQILSEINKAQYALREACLNNEEKQIKIEILKEKINNEDNILKKKLHEVDIKKLLNEISATEDHMSGAVRKITALLEQKKSIMEKNNIKDFDEIDFEEEEEKYHIMKAFEQALNAARTRGGVIDEGNHIYLFQIGINGSSAQVDIRNYLSREGELISKNIRPQYKMTMDFLEAMSKKYKGCSRILAKERGMTGEISKEAAISVEDIKQIGERKC